jgi:hypothetical protein
MLEGTLQISASPASPDSPALAIALAPASEQYLAQVAAQKAGARRKTAEQARLDYLATHPDPDTLPPADGAYLWRSGLWLPLPRNNARVVRSTLQKIGGLWGAALSLVKTRPDKQDTGTLVFDGAVEPPAASAADPLIILAYRGPVKIHAGLPENRIPIEIAPLKISGRLRAAELARLGASAATFAPNAVDATIVRHVATNTTAATDTATPTADAGHPVTPTASASIYLIRINRALPPGRYALAAPDYPFEFEVSQSR